MSKKVMSKKVMSKSKKVMPKKVMPKSKKVMSKKVMPKKVAESAVRVEGMKLEVIGRCHNGSCVFLKRKTPINTSMLRK